MKTHTSNNQKLLAGLAQVITATAEVLGHEITPAAVEMMARDLVEYPPEQVATALQACRRELKGRLTLAAILDRVAVQDGHPEPNEAWAIALRGQDEAQSVGMTQQISTALYAALTILERGDEIGARMAFLDAYKRELAKARQDKQPAKWFISAGWDAQGRVDEIERMASAGLIQQDERQRLLVNHQHSAALPAPEGDAAVIAGLITGRPSSVTPTEEALKRIAFMREQILGGIRDADQKKRDERERTERLKQEAAARVQEKLAQEAKQ